MRARRASLSSGSSPPARLMPRLTLASHMLAPGSRITRPRSPPWTARSRSSRATCARQDFPWLGRLEAATADIRAELMEVLREESAFKPYVEGDARLPQTEHQEMLNNPSWSAFYLWKQGDLVPQNAARCPKTVAALADAPFAQVKNRSPSVMFSLLRPGAGGKTSPKIGRAHV